MDTLAQIVTDVANPYSFAAICVAALVAILRLLIANDLIVRFSRDETREFLQILLKYLFVLALVAIILASIVPGIIEMRRIEVSKRPSDTDLSVHGPLGAISIAAASWKNVFVTIDVADKYREVKIPKVTTDLSREGGDRYLLEQICRKVEERSEAECILEETNKGHFIVFVR